MTPTARRSVLFCAFPLLLLVGSRSTVHAQTWTGRVNENWFEARNWRSGQVPGGGGSFFTRISGGYQVTIAGGQAHAPSLFTESGASLSVTAGGTLTVANLLSVGDQTSLTVNGVGSTVTANDVRIYGAAALTNGGQLRATSGFFNYGPLEVDGGGSRLLIPDDRVGETPLQSGTLTLSRGGTVGTTAGDGVLDNQGTINVGADADATPVAPGMVSLARIISTVQGTVQFNHTSDDYIFAAAIEAGNQVIQNAGHTILTGQNTYDGGTLVRGGTLSVNGSIDNSYVYVTSGGTLGGTGWIGSSTAIYDGGRLAPGNSAGTLTFGHDLNLLDGSTVNFELGTISDLIRITGGTFGGSQSVGASP